MTFPASNPEKDDVSKLIDSLYEELMLLRFEYMKLKRSGRKDLDDKKTLIEGLNEEFTDLIKTHTIYLRFQKASGVTNANHSAEMLQKINEIKANVGSIVSLIPKVNQDGF
jgi:hypothetical protein